MGVNARWAKRKESASLGRELDTGSLRVTGIYLLSGNVELGLTI
jgi:hypothetical protein